MQFLRSRTKRAIIFLVAILIFVITVGTNCTPPGNNGDGGNIEPGNGQIMELSTEKGLIKITIENGTFLEDPTITSMASAPFAGYYNLYGTLNFSFQISSSNKLRMQIRFPNTLEARSKLYYYTGAGWVQISSYEINGNTLSLEFLDNGMYDKDSRTGIISTNLAIFIVGVGDTKLKTWKVINSNDHILSVAHASNLFVAVASYNQRGIYTSANAQNFVLRRLMPADFVLAASDIVILKSRNKFWRSSDGSNWTEITRIEGAISLTKYRPDTTQRDIFVALLDDGIYHSADGVEWTKQASREVPMFVGGSTYTGWIESLKYGSTGGNMILGFLNVNNNSISALSVDGGKTWFINTLPELRYLDTAFISDVAVRISNPINRVDIYRLNTSTWEWESIDYVELEFGVEHLYVIDNRFVAVGKKLGDSSNCYLSISLNGQTWSTGYRIPEPSHPEYDNIVITSDNSVYVFYSLTRTYLLSGSSINQLKSYPYDIQPQSIRFLQGKFWLVHKNGLLTSMDGENWTQETGISSEKNLTDIAYGNGVYVVTSKSEKIYRSVDGSRWDEFVIDLPEGYQGASLSKIIFAKNKFIAIGNVSSRDGAVPKAVFVSDNALTWHVTTHVASKELLDLMYSGKDDKFIAIGYDRTMIKSANGINWEPVNATALGNYQSLIYAGGKYVLITGNIYTGGDLENLGPSTIYLNGEPYSGGLYLHTVCYAEGVGMYIAAGGGYEDHQFIALSRDGLGWEFIRTYVQSEDRYLLNGDLKALAYGNGKVVAIGSPGLILVAQTK